MSFLEETERRSRRGRGNEEEWPPAAAREGVQSVFVASIAGEFMLTVGWCMEPGVTLRLHGNCGLEPGVTLRLHGNCGLVHGAWSDAQAAWELWVGAWSDAQAAWELWVGLDLIWLIVPSNLQTPSWVKGMHGAMNGIG
jgi:hypothetical protein